MPEIDIPVRSRKERTDQDYTIDALLKGLQVLEALEGTSFEPVSIQRVQERTRLPYDTCMRALRTLKLAGFAVQNGRCWSVSTRYLAFGQRAAKVQNGL